MKSSELKNLTNEELAVKHSELKQQLYNLNYQRKFGNVEKPHVFKQVKKDIARIHTVLNSAKDKSR